MIVIQEMLTKVTITMYGYIRTKIMDSKAERLIWNGTTQPAFTYSKLIIEAVEHIINTLFEIEKKYIALQKIYSLIYIN